MLAIRRSLVSFSAAILLFVLAAAWSHAADADKPALRSTLPSHLNAATPSKEHPVRVAEKASRSSHDKVNINTADVKTLMTLTGVSRRVAEKIVEHRDNHGPFKRADELRKVEGVGNGVWEKNRDRVVTK